VQGIELHANRIARCERIDFACHHTQCFHAWNDSELRESRKRQHDQHENVTERERPRSSEQDAIEEQRTGQENNSAADPHPVQLQQRAANYASGKVR